ncbi:MAG: GNAT family N-acetyltransferase [Steroidobacteraceae bacterium]
MSIRRLLPSEAAKLGGHLARLTSEERTLRFMGAMSDEAVRDHCARIDWFRTVVIGFFDAGVLRGAAELWVDYRHFPLSCEAAVTVEAAWQAHGVATELLRRSLLIAQNRGACSVHIQCFGDNRRMQHVARKFGAHFSCRSGQCDADILTPAPSCASLYEEATDENIGWMRCWLDAMTVRAPRSAA